MTDFDLDRLQHVWRQQPDAQELERLQRSAAAVARRARYARILDFAAAALVSVVVIVLVWSKPRLEPLLMGGAAILILLASNARQRSLRRIELKGLTGTTEDMLDQSIERIEKTIRHNRLTLMAIAPTFLVAFLFAATAVETSGPLFGPLQGSPLLRLLWLGGWSAALIGLVVVLALAIRRGRRELERLTSMRESYRREHEFGERD